MTVTDVVEQLAGVLPKWEVLAQTPRFYKGTLIRHPKVSHFQVKNVQVTQSGDTPTLLEADGEFLGHTPATFSIVAKALKIAWECERI